MIHIYFSDPLPSPQRVFYVHQPDDFKSMRDAMSCIRDARFFFHHVVFGQPGRLPCPLQYITPRGWVFLQGGALLNLR